VNISISHVLVLAYKSNIINAVLKQPVYFTSLSNVYNQYIYSINKIIKDLRRSEITLRRKYCTTRPSLQVRSTIEHSSQFISTRSHRSVYNNNTFTLY